MSGSVPAHPGVLAAVVGDIVGSKAIADRAALKQTMTTTVERLNGLFAPALVEPFAVETGDELRGVLSDPAQAPLCVAVMRETLAPIMVRVGIAVAPDGPQGAQAARDDAAAAMLLAKEEDGLARYHAGGKPGEVLLRSLCRLVDPLLRSRTAEQWTAVAAYRDTGDKRRVARRLKVSADEVEARLAAADWGPVEEADSAIAAYLSRLYA
jgi:hypothetical protein